MQGAALVQVRKSSEDSLRYPAIYNFWLPSVSSRALVKFPVGTKVIPLCHISPGCVAWLVTARTAVRRAEPHDPVAGAQSQVIASSSSTVNTSTVRTKMSSFQEFPSVISFLCTNIGHMEGGGRRDGNCDTGSSTMSAN